MPMTYGGPGKMNTFSDETLALRALGISVGVVVHPVQGGWRIFSRCGVIDAAFYNASSVKNHLLRMGARARVSESVEVNDG